jgi:hypothetical protein
LRLRPVNLPFRRTVPKSFFAPPPSGPINLAFTPARLACKRGLSREKSENVMRRSWAAGRDSNTTCCASLRCSGFDPRLNPNPAGRGSCRAGRPSHPQAWLRRSVALPMTPWPLPWS